MRGLLLIFVLGSAMAFVISYPFVGFLTWEWLNLMSPHRLTYGSATSMNFVEWVAVATIAAWAISKERKVPEVSVSSVLLLGFLAWLFVSQSFSLDAVESRQYFDRFLKVIVFALFAFLFIEGRLRIQAVIWILVLSTSFYGVKGGAFTILSGGGSHVQGPPGSILHSNNHLGLAIASMIPLLVFLYQTSRSLMVRNVLVAAGVLDVFAILGTQSRGAFVASLSMGALLWWRSSRRIWSLTIMAAVILPVIMFMPESWSDRMLTIQDYDTDTSFQSRVDAWAINWDVAVAHPLTGAGLRVPYSQEIAMRYTEDFRTARAAHSIYFEILGGMGFVGLVIFGALLVRTQLVLLKLRKQFHKTGRDRWKFDLATALQISITALMVGGIVQSMEMWEGLWLIIVLSAALERVYQTGSVSKSSSNRLSISLPDRTH